MHDIHPFLKWAGGKRWLVQKHYDLFPKQFERYIEPFVGSGAVFFALQPSIGVLSDCNHALIEAYNAIKLDYKAVLKALKVHQENHSFDYYYKIRASTPRTIYTRAARFIYLNRTCWNGLYRVNQAGMFNVPKGTKNNVVLETDDFGAISLLLQNSEIMKSDFEAVISSARSGDFVFADPPYTIKHNKNNFVKYNEELFHWENQERLRDALISADKKGVQFMLTNAAHPSVKELYGKCGFNVIELERASVIASQAARRGVYTELIVRNWT